MTGSAVHFSAGIGQFAFFSMTGHTSSDGFVRIGGSHKVVTEEIVKHLNSLSHYISGQPSTPFLSLLGH